jgi:hypothetical protein
VPLLIRLAPTPKKPVANRTVAQLLRGSAAAQGLVRLSERAGSSQNPGSHSFSGTQDSVSPAPSFYFPRVWDVDARESLPALKKSQNKAGMLMIIKRFYFWNPSKAGMYMKKQPVTRKSWNATDNKDVILLSTFRLDFILLKALCLSCCVGENY